jgi:hypothetical protein
MFDSRIFYLQMADTHRHRPQAVRIEKRREPRAPSAGTGR